MLKNWKVKPKIPREVLQKYPDMHPIVAQLLYNRDLLENGKYKEFLEPKYEGLHSPFLFQDMEKAAGRIWQAFEDNHRITIYGDYDADAVTANAVLRQGFKYLNYQNVDSYIPDRFSEGYGVNLEALSKIKDKGSRIIITVDCGTNSTEAAKWCKENVIDFIITDHHEVVGQLPDAYALINPKNLKDSYPDKNITGVGVAFKLVQAMLSQKEKVTNRLSFRSERSGVEKSLKLSQDKGPLDSARDDRKYIDGYEKWLLDLVAIGTVADCHSLTGENRIFVKYGLKVLYKTKWPGLKALCKNAGLDFSKKQPDTYTLGFVVAPRLNAAGRLEHANIALDLLLEKDFAKALEQALKLDEINRRRQDLTMRVLSEAREQALQISDRKVLVLLGQDWPQGVVGLVAGRLAQEFKKPVIVLSAGENEAVGSARTAGDYNVVEALKYASKHLLAFGGHAQAAGLTLKTREFENFYKKLSEHAEKNLTGEEFAESGVLDAELPHEQLGLSVISEINKLEPFGVDNPKPKFLIRNLNLDSLKNVGTNGDHAQIRLRASGSSYSAIWFKAGERAASFVPGDAVSAVCELMEDSWNGNMSLKLRIVEIEK